ncbi:MAG: hypothetical protein ABW071_01290 [Casimicrobiaceae bacterium]
MDMFKKKSLYAALAGMSALGAVGAAQAVNLNPDGLGQVLIYPYYTVRNVLPDTPAAPGTVVLTAPFNTLLSVVNSTASAKAVKVRFLEGRNSREVLDFNLYLSAKDVWGAALVPNDAGGATMLVTDKSCTLPRIPAVGVPFRALAYSSDGAGSTLDRTKEGYIEIIEMATYDDASTTAQNITHSSGVPDDCAAQTDALGASEAQPPNGGLFGGVTLINVLEGSAYSADAVALDNYSIAPLYTGAGFDTPNLENASPPISVVVTDGVVYRSTWVPGTADPVSAVLMHDTIMNEYVLDLETASATDWVVTFPTKRYYVANGTGPASSLFQRNFNKTAGACDDVSLTIYDREEQTTFADLDFSPLPEEGSTCLPWEANVISFGNLRTVFHSANGEKVNPPAGFQHGWMQLGFQPVTVTGFVHTLRNNFTVSAPLGEQFGSSGPATYVGLPVIGFAAQSFFNGTLNVENKLVQSTYGGNFVQKGTRLILTDED